MKVRLINLRKGSILLQAIQGKSFEAITKQVVGKHGGIADNFLLVLDYYFPHLAGSLASPQFAPGSFLFRWTFNSPDAILSDKFLVAATNFSMSSGSNLNRQIALSYTAIFEIAFIQNRLKLFKNLLLGKCMSQYTCLVKWCHIFM